MAKQKMINSLDSLMTQATDTLPVNKKQEPEVRKKPTVVPEVMPNPTAEKKKVGRKPKNRTIQRVDGITIYFDQNHKDMMSRIGGFDKQDIIRTAVDEFFKKYMNNGLFVEEGRALIERYIESTTFTPETEKTDW